MTAVQQFWIVDPEVFLVSPIYPIVVRDGNTIADGAPGARGLDRSLLDYFAITDSPATALSLIVEEFAAEVVLGADGNPIDTGSPLAVSLDILSAGVNQYQNAMEANSTNETGAPAASSLVVTTVVVTYTNLMDTLQTNQTGAPSALTLTVT